MTIGGITYSDTMRFNAEICDNKGGCTTWEKAHISNLRGYCRTINKHFSGFFDVVLANLKVGESIIRETPRRNYKFTKIAE